MQLATHLGVVLAAEEELAKAFREVAAAHADEPDVRLTCQLVAGWSDEHAAALGPVLARYGAPAAPGPAALGIPREGPLGLLRDLQSLHALASAAALSWTIASQALHDEELLDLAGRCEQENQDQLAWLMTRIKQAAPQVLVAS